MTRDEFRKTEWASSFNSQLLSETCDRPDFIGRINNYRDELSTTPEGQVILAQAQLITEAIATIRLNSKIQAWKSGRFQLWNEKEYAYMREHYPDHPLT